MNRQIMKQASVVFSIYYEHEVSLSGHPIFWIV